MTLSQKKVRRLQGDSDGQLCRVPHEKHSTKIQSLPSVREKHLVKVEPLPSVMAKTHLAKR
jgi:hypothetical protein